MKNFALQLYDNLKPVVNQADTLFTRTSQLSNIRKQFREFPVVGNGRYGITFLVPGRAAQKYADASKLGMRVHTPPSEAEVVVKVTWFGETNIAKNFASDLVREANVLRYIFPRMPRGSVPRIYFAGADRARHVGVIGMEYIADATPVPRTVTNAQYWAVDGVFRALWLKTGIFHMDAHRQNVLLRPNDTAALIDFTLATKIPEGLLAKLQRAASPSVPIFETFARVVSKREQSALWDQYQRNTPRQSWNPDWIFLSDTYKKRSMSSSPLSASSASPVSPSSSSQSRSASASRSASRSARRQPRKKAMPIRIRSIRKFSSSGFRPRKFGNVWRASALSDMASPSSSNRRRSIPAYFGAGSLRPRVETLKTGERLAKFPIDPLRRYSFSPAVNPAEALANRGGGSSGRAVNPTEVMAGDIAGKALGIPATPARSPAPPAAAAAAAGSGSKRDSVAQTVFQSAMSQSQPKSATPQSPSPALGIRFLSRYPNLKR